MDNRTAQFVHTLYFDMQTIEDVLPLEIWNSVREMEDPYEKALLLKNLCKIVVPLVNECCRGRPFERHAVLVREGVRALLSWITEDPSARVLARFPDPPVGDAAQKDLYRLVRDRAAAILPGLPGCDGHLQAAAGSLGAPARVHKGSRRPPAPDDAIFPVELFDFREMRLVDNELPYIIFTDKEYRVIHGLAVVYLWLIDLDAIYLEALEENGVDPAIAAEYRAFTRRVHRENPLTIRGKKMSTAELAALIHEKLRYEDYLDVFEEVHTWLEQTARKLRPA
jgi:hypothetical protein